jgi:hypothetical protein
VEDIERLKREGGFSAVLRAIEKDLLSRARKSGDSRRLYTIMAGLGMRAGERREVTDNSQS